ncbi:methionyl-tRNA formyltransferase [Bosea sp. PAMC 26642]|uniref:methionyl-tRNA formyltransferase n=1 Tax=Bosea sp. (strain PAMC 26642) TaxID=1792307 RepID=UPI0007701054|nr:methionyl-tRNA formyltransferase [Bosea sp. PAMC 26642]AMJ63118.1 methionyl-tRNA formyltransferase [Bosea sp. PAMC 26642]
MTLRVIFMGTPDFAVPTLTEIIGQGHEVVSCYTRAPAQAGRGLELKPSPVQRAAERFGIPVFTPKSLRTDEAAETVASHQADVAVVVAYGMILPQAILDLPELGCLNLHGSLLPRWRGAAPIQRAVMAGDAESGVCVMKMEAGLDTGPVGMVEKLVIGPDMTAGELHDALAPLGADLMVRALAALGRGALRFTPQPEEGVTYAAKLGNAEGQLNWARPARQLHDLVRGLSPFPGAYAEIDLGKGAERLKVLRTALAGGAAEPGTLLDGEGTIACTEGAVKLLQVQRAGGKPMSGAEFLRGARLAAGSKL